MNVFIAPSSSVREMITVLFLFLYIIIYDYIKIQSGTEYELHAYFHNK